MTGWQIVALIGLAVFVVFGWSVMMEDIGPLGAFCVLFIVLVVVGTAAWMDGVTL